MMHRRRFIISAAALAATPVSNFAQHPRRLPRVVLFGLFVPVRDAVDAFHQGLRDLGLVDGQNVSVEVRSADGKPELLNEAGADLVRARVDIIVTAGTDASRAAHQATRTIPIVTAVGADPVVIGFAKTLSPPGGNVTGLTSAANEISIKQLELLHESIPNVSRVGVLWRRLNPNHEGALKALQASARSLGIELHPVPARAGELDRAFSGMAEARVHAVLVLGDALFLGERGRIVQLAAQSAIPGVYFRRDFAEMGGLFSYATDTNDLYRRAAGYVEKIM
jgi:putative ABC transport system substrate-binding protein